MSLLLFQYLAGFEKGFLRIRKRFRILPTSWSKNTKMINIDRKAKFTTCIASHTHLCQVQSVTKLLSHGGLNQWNAGEAVFTNTIATNPGLKVNLFMRLFTWCCMHLSPTLLISCVSVLTAAIVVGLHTPAPVVCQPIWPWADVLEHNVSIIIKPERKYDCSTSEILSYLCLANNFTISKHLSIVQVITNDHLIVKHLNRTGSDLGTELIDSLFLLGPVMWARGAPDAPVGYLSLQLPVGLLQPVHLLQEAPQSGI